MKRVKALISFIAPGDLIMEAGQEQEIDRGLALDLEKIGFVQAIQTAEKPI
jgi:hypothetical protein